MVKRRASGPRRRIARARVVGDAASDGARESPAAVAGELEVAEFDLSKLSYREALDMTRERATREYLVALMNSFEGNVSRAAERAGIARESLHRLLKRYDMDPDAFRLRSR